MLAKFNLPLVEILYNNKHDKSKIFKMKVVKNVK